MRGDSRAGITAEQMSSNGMCIHDRGRAYSLAFAEISANILGRNDDLTVVDCSIGSLHPSR